MCDKSQVLIPAYQLNLITTESPQLAMLPTHQATHNNLNKDLAFQLNV